MTSCLIWDVSATKVILFTSTVTQVYMCVVGWSGGDGRWLHAFLQQFEGCRAKGVELDAALLQKARDQLAQACTLLHHCQHTAYKDMDAFSLEIAWSCSKAIFSIRICRRRP